MTEQDDRDRAAAGPQGNTAACREIHETLPALDFAGNGGKGTAGRAFLKAPQNVFQLSRPHHDQSGRINAEVQQPGAMKPAGFLSGPDILDHQNRPGPYGQKPCKKREAKAAERPGIAAFGAGHLMQGPQFKSAVRQAVAGLKQPVESLQPQGAPGGEVIWSALSGRFSFETLSLRLAVRRTVFQKTVRPLRVGGGRRGRTKLRLKGEATLKIRNAATQLGKRCAMFGCGGHCAR
jgi:hypothetical protein